MKRLLLASAVLGFVGTIGPANAFPLVANNLTIWNAIQPGFPITDANSPTQQALPTNPIASTAPLATGPAAGDINFDLEASDILHPATIGVFLATSPTFIRPANCLATCLVTMISQAGFRQETLFDFRFVTASPIAGTITHDDGISLFMAGGSTTNLIPGHSGVTTADDTFVSIGPGTYDLWYLETGGLPETAPDGLPAVLLTTFEIVSGASIPEPASLMLLASGLVGFGWFGRRRRKPA